MPHPKKDQSQVGAEKINPQSATSHFYTMVPGINMKECAHSEPAERRRSAALPLIDRECPKHMSTHAALNYAIVSISVIVFQRALAAGAPWGAYAMGGTFPGQLPPALRGAAVVQAALLAGMALVILAGAGIVRRGRPALSRWLVWFVVAFAIKKVS